MESTSGASLFSFISYFTLEGLRYAKNKCGKDRIQGKLPAFRKQINITLEVPVHTHRYVFVGSFRKGWHRVKD